MWTPTWPGTKPDATPRRSDADDSEIHRKLDTVLRQHEQMARMLQATMQRLGMTGSASDCNTCCGCTLAASADASHPPGGRPAGDGAEAASPRALASMAVAGGLCRLISLLAFRGHAPSVGLHTARRLRACRAVCDLVLWRMSPQVQDRLRKCGVLSLPLRLLWCADPAVVSLTVLALSYATKKSRHNAAHVRTELDAIMAAYAP